DQKSRSPDGEVSTEDWMRLVCQSIVSVVSKGDWRRAFLRIWSNEQPTPDAVMSIFPARWKVNVLSYVLWQPKSQRAKGREESRTQEALSARQQKTTVSGDLDPGPPLPPAEIAAKMAQKMTVADIAKVFQARAFVFGFG
ncbi:unnamed protein product, partial [Symbiodinium necroappetens]